MLHPIPPVDYFKELLAMDPVQRDRALATKTPEQKRLLLAKIAEYQSMSNEERELRLRHTELRWNVTRLMKMPRLERITELAAIPLEKRAMVEERLRRWDEVPLPLQKEFLENEALIQRVLAWETTPSDLRAKLTLEEREKLRQELTAWRSLPEQKRQLMSEQFRQFFELNDDQKKKILGSIPAVEREQMAKALEKYETLPSAMRQRCIDSFTKFAAMSSDERAEFMKNAERWESMTPNERRAWRDLVNRLPPLPPMPPSLKVHPTTALVATNGIK
ncbi:MAG: hypothetical protein JWM68_3951 [Verrucomicrobiales bacterium]|nr:hypothetical protein [Verrucomicrobiales bacterium]